MKIKKLCTIIGCVSNLSLCAQFPNSLVSKESASWSQVSEPSVAINPMNVNEVAVGAILDFYAYSKNGGLDWKVSHISSKYGVWGDPVLAFDSKGRLYYFHLANYSETSWIDRIICQYTDKVNQTFSVGSYPTPNGTKAQDKHWVDIDPVSNTIYMTWTQFDQYDSKDPKDSSVILFSKSEDRGITWTKPLRISFYAGDCLDGDNTVEGAVPAIAKDGSLYVTWSGPKGLVFQKSTDDGLTWLSVEKEIMKHPGGWDMDVPGIYRTNGLPTFAVDKSNGPNSGTLYLSWCDQSKGTQDTDVWMAHSKDKGETWSAPKRVNQDKTKTHQFFETMVIDQSNGNLHWLYYDRRNYAEKDLRTDVFWASSTDGGQTISDQKISEKAFFPDKKVFFGDYIALAAHKGKVVPIWVRMDKGQTSIWTADLSKP